MARRGLILTLIAGAVIAPRRIVGVGADEHHVVQANSGDSLLIGISDLGADAAEDRVDVVMSDTAEVEFGGVVPFGSPIMADADGKAVVATDGKNAIGQALISAVAGDVGDAHIYKHKA